MNKLILIIVVSFFTCSCKKEKGCTDPYSLNFNPYANIDDNSCITNVQDIDGNIYNYTIIGEQKWLTENLKTTTYNTGKKIKNVTNSKDWSESNEAAYCWYSNDSINKEINGALYNYKAIESNNLCPKGWRIPYAYDWLKLVDFISTKEDTNNVALFLKSIDGWFNNSNGNNKYNWNAIPSGGRSYDGTFLARNFAGHWWSLDGFTDDISLGFSLTHVDYKLITNGFKNSTGLCVRCMKDNE